MRFFTEEKMVACIAYSEYEAYWKRNLHRISNACLRVCAGMLPPHFFDSIEDPIFLHDSKIQLTEHHNTTLTLVLHGDNQGDLRKTDLVYQGVKNQPVIPSHLLQQTADCDLACHEFTIISDKSFNHRLLFASGDQLSINFVDLKVDSRL